MSRPERSGGRVTTTEKKLIARGCLSPTKEVTGSRRATMAQEGGASAFFCGRRADCELAREPGRPNEVRSLRERARVLKNRRAEAVSAQRLSADGPEHHRIAAEWSVRGFYAVAEPAATPEDRQSERSEVCRDRAKEKYKMPEGRACRRAAVVRPAPEAGREPLRGGRVREARRLEGRSAARP